ncbi:hypothetical protein P3T76_015981 [Phytophthora citrophthora]|uniref:Uncharacterized protein n=1 Tax=Phytophthora citrophthora TaxID=4793 RepID=A0AAD9FYU9_9STRA|nr:hypothetical protein P3T76_015981 [Phytophthora citrophthora]
MVVVRSPTGQRAGGGLLEDQRRVQMERRTGDVNHVVVMASPEEVRTAQMTRQTAESRASLAAQTQRRLLAYAHRARHVLSHRSVVNQLSQTRRSEMLSEIQHLKDEIQSLQAQIEVTTRSVESMERLAFHLERLTREFLPREPNDGVRVTHGRSELSAMDTQPGGEQEDS